MDERMKRLPELLLPWFRANARSLPWRADREPYHVWLSEIMLQQTRVEAVKGYYSRFLVELPDIKSLAEAEALGGSWLLFPDAEPAIRGETDHGTVRRRVPVGV